MRAAAPGTGGKASELEDLLRLAELHGIEPSHHDGFGRETRPSPEAVMAVLSELGAPVRRMEDVPGALRERRAQLASRLLEPVSVSWGSDPCLIPRGPGLPAGRPVKVQVTGEDGATQEVRAEAGPGGVHLPTVPAPGYHQVRIRTEGKTASTLLVAAPPRAYGAGGPGEGEARELLPARPDDGDGGLPRPEWGVFLPLHALRSAGDRGVGTLTDLGRLMAWTGKRGGQVVGTLPLMAAFLDEPLEPSPYAPVSRLFWNELFLDVTRLPEWERTPGARERAGSHGFQERLLRVRHAPEVDYREAYRLQAELLGLLAHTWERSHGPGDPDFQRFLHRNPQAEAYASFRAALARRGDRWAHWPREWREGGIPPSEQDRSQRRFHLYVQFRFQEQLGEVAAVDGPDGAGLYLDLPLGAHPDGFDTWAHPGLLGTGASLGAPPDAFHRGGQDWGLPPILPEAARLDGHRHFRQVLQGLLPRSRYLRIDHVMGLHRLYWVPRGADAAAGVYVRNPSEELLAILTLESHRHQTVLVGEDLGTVPEGVRRDMDARGLRRMFVVPFELGPEAPPPRPSLKPVPPGAVASLNTHDMATFAAHWADEGTRRRLREVAVDGGASGRFLSGREAHPGWPEALRVLRGILDRLGRSSAGLVLVNLEDLWLEEAPQNVPGTPGVENWRRKARMSLEEFAGDPRVLACLENLRKARGSPDAWYANAQQDRNREGRHATP